jgi:murein DD-endopeptidase MepM/ murein hydrolase activator NlpD
MPRIGMTGLRATTWLNVASAGVVVSLLFAACDRSAPPQPPRPSIARDVDLRADTTLVRGLVPANTTLDTMLRAHGLSGDTVSSVIDAARAVFDPRRLRSMQPFSLEWTLSGAVRRFEYEIDADRFLRVAPQDEDGGLRAAIVPIPKTLEHVVAHGTIDADAPSLFQAMDAAGESAELAIGLAGIFSGQIDFNTELQPADAFAVAFERFHREGRPDSAGEITAAEFHNDGRVIRAIRFTPPGGKPDYFDENGRSVRRFFLRSPLKFEPRVTSGFSLSRMHPVLHTARAHRGVDYGAPTGAPVVAVAAGTVVSATYDNANGRMVRLRHPSGYESYYLHLSAFAGGIRAGVHVSQGETIGLVGSTGLATGPHLHFGLKRNGTFVNPLREQRNLPPGDPVPAEAMAAFRTVRDEALRALAGAAPQNEPSDVAAD